MHVYSFRAVAALREARGKGRNPTPPRFMVRWSDNEDVSLGWKRKMLVEPERTVGE